LQTAATKKKKQKKTPESFWPGLHYAAICWPLYAAVVVPLRHV